MTLRGIWLSLISVLRNTHRVLLGAGIGLLVCFQLWFEILVITELSHYTYNDLSFAWLQMITMMIAAFFGGIAGFASRDPVHQN